MINRGSINSIDVVNDLPSKQENSDSIGISDHISEKSIEI